jgi:hypothetical protein
MLNTRSLYIFVALALIMAACGNGVTGQPSNANSDNNLSPTTGGEPVGNGLSNSRFDSITITDKMTGTILPSEKPMSIFPHSINFISVYASILNVKKGDQMTGIITAVDAPGFDPSGLLGGTNSSSTKPLDKDFEGIQTSVDFFDLDGEWPTGTYKIEVYFNGKLDTVFNFTIQ